MRQWQPNDAKYCISIPHIARKTQKKLIGLFDNQIDSRKFHQCPWITFHPKLQSFNLKLNPLSTIRATFPSWWKGIAINFNIENYWPNEIIFGKDVEHEWGWCKFLAIFLNVFLRMPLFAKKAALKGWWTMNNRWQIWWLETMGDKHTNNLN